MTAIQDPTEKPAVLHPDNASRGHGVAYAADIVSVEDARPHLRPQLFSCQHSLPAPKARTTRLNIRPTASRYDQTRT